MLGCQGVVQHAQRPVLIVRPGPDDLDRVLVGYDGSPQAKRAVQFLDRLNLKPDVVIELAYVVEPFVPPKGGGARFRKHAADELRVLNEQQQRDAEKALEVVYNWTLYKKHKELHKNIINFIKTAYVPEQVLKMKREDSTRKSLIFSVS